MRFAGRITEWHDEKGYGFVMPNGGGERAFVHVSEFRRGARRPVAGDLVSYVLARDAQGRGQARELRHVGAPATKNPGHSVLPWIAGAMGLLVMTLALSLGRLPAWVAGVCAGLSVLSWLTYFGDKRAARKGAQRTPENTLHLIDLLGGWPGGLIAQQQFRHKTIKQPFQGIFWLTVLLNLAALIWLASGRSLGVVLSLLQG